MDQQQIALVVQGKRINVPAKFGQVSSYINSLMALGFEDDEQIVVDRISEKTLSEILSFYNLCQYQDVLIKTPIRTNDLQGVMNSKYAQFICKHDFQSPEFKDLYRGAEFLGCKNLFRVCAARFACHLYFDDSKQAFEAKQKELGVKVNVQFEDNQKFKKLYPFMNT